MTSHKALLPWAQIDTVLLDMDGTLLDLHFDNYFWLEHVPQKISEIEGISLQQAKTRMSEAYAAVTGTIHWYCLDYWSDKLGLDIVAAKREIEHLIGMRDDTLPFLDALKASGREVVLVTNAHPDSLSLKIERTQLDSHINNLISTHEFGVTKESLSLWQQLHQRLGFDPARTLFVDDSVNLLHTAREFGIAHVLAVANPDSKGSVRIIDDVPAITDYRTMLEDILANPVVA